MICWAITLIGCQNSLSLLKCEDGDRLSQTLPAYHTQIERFDFRRKLVFADNVGISQGEKILF